jgi:hypothetical protein
MILSGKLSLQQLVSRSHCHLSPDGLMPSCLLELFTHEQSLKADTTLPFNGIYEMHAGFLR